MMSFQAVFNVPSDDPVRRSRRFCGVMPSGLPEDPAGNVLRFLIMSSGEIWRAWNRRLPLNSLGCLRSSGAFGCLCLSASSDSGFAEAGVSSEQSNRMAARKFPASSLTLIAAAS